MPDGQNQYPKKTSPKDSEAKRIIARRDHLQRLRRVFESPDGQIILAWLHSTASTAKPRFRPGEGYNPNIAAYRDGRASIVLEIDENLREANASHGAKDSTDKPTATGGRPSTASKRGRKTNS